MPEKHHYYQGFIAAMQEKIPQRGALVNTIADLLTIDKNAVYRRLRGEVNFTFVEVATIAIKLGISLDNIVGNITLENRPLQMTMAKHVNPTDADYRMFNNYTYLLSSIKDQPDTLLLEATNTLSNAIYYDYDNVTRLHVFSWYLGNNDGTDALYHEVTVPEQMRDMQKKCSEYTRHIKNTQYVWDRRMFDRIVENIKFWVRMRFIKEEDVLLIKNDFLEMLDYLEKLAVRGKYEETGNEVSIYISELLLETSYTTIKSQNLYYSQFKTFFLNSNISLDEDVYNKMSKWIFGLQRKATLISVSGEKIRSEFFNTQRKIIHTL